MALRRSPSIFCSSSSSSGAFAVRSTIGEGPFSSRSVLPATLQRRMPPSALRLLQSRLAMGDALGASAVATACPMKSTTDPDADDFTAAGAIIHHSTAKGGGGLVAGSDPLTRVTTLCAALTFIATYYIIFDWIYRGYCLHWDGMYITDGDDDDDDGEGGDDDDVTNDNE